MMILRHKLLLFITMLYKNFRKYSAHVLPQYFVDRKSRLHTDKGPQLFWGMKCGKMGSAYSTFCRKVLWLSQKHL